MLQLKTSAEVLSPRKLKVGLQIRLKLKMEKRLGNGLEVGLPKGLRQFYNWSEEVVGE